jgi:hypothetical protein
MNSRRDLRGMSNINFTSMEGVSCDPADRNIRPVLASCHILNTLTVCTEVMSLGAMSKPAVSEKTIQAMISPSVQKLNFKATSFGQNNNPSQYSCCSGLLVSQ